MVDVLKDIEAVQDFLKDLHFEEQALLKNLAELHELEQEFEVGKEEVKKANLQAQATIYEMLMQRYGFFQNDAQVNGIRIKMMADQFLKNCESADLKEIAKEKKKQWSNLW
jgi:hypothetical protein